MQCENGYTKPGVKGILCRKCEEPKKKLKIISVSENPDTLKFI